MDPELTAWTDRQTSLLQSVVSEQQRLADAVSLLAREIANIGMLLAPQGGDCPTPLEQLLAQLVAQGQEQVRLLRHLTHWARRMEGGAGSNDAGGRAAGNGKPNGPSTPP